LRIAGPTRRSISWVCSRRAWRVGSTTGMGTVAGCFR
jgi:hypothetical protein